MNENTLVALHRRPHYRLCFFAPNPIFTGGNRGNPDTSGFSLCAPVQDFCVEPYMAKKEEMPVMEQKPGRYWGVIGRQHMPYG
jgi:hypothetical protein